MKHTLKTIASGLAVLLVFGLAMTGCKKQEAFVAPQAPFFMTASGTYRILAANQSFKIPVGLTAVSNNATPVTVTVTSPTGAQAGTHYTLPASLSIPAGKAIDSLTVNAVLSQYQAGRVDTLVFTISNPDRSPNLRNTYRLVISGPCFEGNVNLNAFIGEYKNTNETFGSSPYGPYTTRVTAVNSLTATTGTITVANVFDAGWNPITFTLDWTDPANRKVTLQQQTGIGDAGTISSTYNGQDISVRNHANGQIGTFSVCNQTIQLRMQTGVTGVGWFGSLYTVNMAR